MLNILTEKMLRLFFFKDDVKKYKQRNVVIAFSWFTANFLVRCKFTAWPGYTPSPPFLYSLADVTNVWRFVSTTFLSLLLGNLFSFFLSFLLYLLFFSFLETIHIFSITHEFISLLFQLLSYKIFQCK